MMGGTTNWWKCVPGGAHRCSRGDSHLPTIQVCSRFDSISKVPSRAVEVEAAWHAHLAVLRGLVLGDLHEVLLGLRRRLALDLEEPFRRHGEHLVVPLGGPRENALGQEWRCSYQAIETS